MKRSLGAFALLLLFGLAGSASAATVIVVNSDDPGEGFNDPTPVAPLPGNPGTTLGQQRLIAFQAAADRWGAVVDSVVPIRVAAFFDPLTCTPSSAVLGAAAPFGVSRDFAAAPRAGTWFHYALANALAGHDLDNGNPDLVAFFNSLINDDPNCVGGFNWWYGVGAEPPDDQHFDFFGVVLHELAHGIGFSTFVDRATGDRFLGFDDVFMTKLEDHSTGKLWHQMNNAQRRASIVDTGDLHWVGGKVIGASSSLLAGRHPSGHVQMYAPNPSQPGSSTSHWDTALVPDELMEPFASDRPLNVVTTQALQDIGWELEQGEPCVADANTLCLVGGRFKVEVDWRTNQGTEGAGTVVAGVPSDNSGLFYFFNADNWEMLLKVLSACGVNDRIWVFYAATTNVEFTVRVTDTLRNETRTYFNPLGQTAPTVTDTAAFATCP